MKNLTNLTPEKVKAAKIVACICLPLGFLMLAGTFIGFQYGYNIFFAIMPFVGFVFVWVGSIAYNIGFRRGKGANGGTQVNSEMKTPKVSFFGHKDPGKKTKCPHCGTEIDSNTRFCPGCGAEINQDDTVFKIGGEDDDK